MKEFNLNYTDTISDVDMNPEQKQSVDQVAVINQKKKKKKEKQRKNKIQT